MRRCAQVAQRDPFKLPLGGIHTAVDGSVAIGADGNATTTVTASYLQHLAQRVHAFVASVGEHEAAGYRLRSGPRNRIFRTYLMKGGTAYSGLEGARRCDRR